MTLFPRRRHGPYALAQPRIRLSSVSVAIVAITGMGTLVLWAVGRLPLPARGETAPVLLTVVGRGEVGVGLAGSTEREVAQTGLRLYPDDRVITPGNAYAILEFFDGSVVRIAQDSEMRIEESLERERRGVIRVVLERGMTWIETAAPREVTRTIQTPLASYELTPGLVGLFTPQTSHLFETTGPGVAVAIPPRGRPVARLTLGEGQELTVTQEDLPALQSGVDPYTLRHPLREDLRESPFVKFNRAQSTPKIALLPPPPAAEPESEEGEPALTVLAPPQGWLATGSTVVVRGRITQRVRSLRINGYREPLRGATFAKEVSLPEEEEVTIEVTAEDAQGLVIATEKRTVRRDLKPPDPPLILAPGSGGSVVALSAPQSVIEGEASPDTTAIVINGYRLQKFHPGDRTWQYIASLDLGNLSYGENTYTVVAHDRSGNSSAPSSITLVWTGGSQEADDDVGQGLSVTRPSPGTPWQTDAPDVLLEGRAPPETATISVNGFTLTQYVPGSPTWHVYLREAFGNYRMGLNTYILTARDSAGAILARTTYQVLRRSNNE